ILKAWHRPGLKALRTESGLPKAEFTARQLCFTIIPRLNSPGRIGSARDVVELLLTCDDKEAFRAAREIEEKNRQRRAHDSRVTEEASYLADIILKRTEPSALVFSSSSWHEGVVGIGAARLAEKYDLPSVLIAVSDGIGKGSARSAGMVNIKEALERCSEYLVVYGGHKEAGGFSILEKDIPCFQAVFEETVCELAEHGGDAGTMRIDAEVSLDMCNMELVSFIGRLAPFGPGNPEPLFLIRNFKVMPGSRIVGNGHLKVAARDLNGSLHELIGFSLGDAWNPDDIIGKELDVLIHLRKNFYKGKMMPKIQMISIRFAKGNVKI
ncbi:MAG: hypothetical protein KAX38_03120, partial [Candidatus Krumholzibacteria bacterium]|nr:hypothetical protein [Candidatus Krumholzibacteria bacterium]